MAPRLCISAFSYADVTVCRHGAVSARMSQFGSVPVHACLSLARCQSVTVVVWLCVEISMAPVSGIVLDCFQRAC